MNFLLLLEIWVQKLVNIGKNVIGKYSKKLLDHAKQSATDALKTSLKRVIQKTAKKLVI